MNLMATEIATIAVPMPSPRSSAKKRVAVLENSSNALYQDIGEMENWEATSVKDSGVAFGFREAMRFPKSELSGWLILPYYIMAKLLSFCFQLLDCWRDQRAWLKC